MPNGEHSALIYREAGRFVLAPVVRPVAELLNEAVENIAALAEARSIRLCVQPGEEEVLADADRVVQVLVNLISNAVKFSPEGSVVTLSAARAGARRVRVEVRDQGRGVAREMQERIFERFQQVHASDAGTRGSGLGLAIVRGIVREHGGEMGVDSELGHGSAFWFTLPEA